MARAYVGLGANLALGKTFWLASNVGLNVGLYFNYMAIPDHSGEHTAVISGCDADAEDCSDIIKYRFSVSNFGLSTGIVFH
jgi:hypothetical protein